MIAKVAAALAVLAAAAVGCGDNEDTTAAGKPAESPRATPAAQPVGPERAGSVTQYADCDDWRAGTPAERRATVDELRGQLTPQTSESEASPLADDRAYEILQKSCTTDFAESLRLYKIYVRAQGFAPLYVE